jgi:hypothetical protein
LHFFDRDPELIDGRFDLLARDDGGGRDQQVIAGEAIDAALHGIREYTTAHCCLSDTSGEIQFGREGLLCFLIRDELEAPEQSDSAHIADGFASAELPEGIAQ